ncbi:hypothetical protein VEx25_0514 [Vibrio antiquarius]|uniref:Uncharacterized protein n=1 Tax=Vibrio antiquarius (strain Ex25) TaxID=150340 RepID=A0ABM9WS79_VIBAE|nr:hypothetical protein VEx25_0514 [Vibrio antiquarius]
MYERCVHQKLMRTVNWQNKCMVCVLVDVQNCKTSV